jgi:hypothetical protein
VVAVELAARAQDRLLAVVVREALEREAALGVRPAGERARGLLDVALAVVPVPQREQLEQLARPVLVGLLLHVLVVVEVLQHRRVARDAAQQLPEAPEGVLVQELELRDQLPGVAHVAERAREVAVPEEQHPLAQRIVAREQARRPLVAELDQRCHVVRADLDATTAAAVEARGEIVRVDQAAVQRRRCERALEGAPLTRGEQLPDLRRAAQRVRAVDLRRHGRDGRALQQRGRLLPGPGLRRAGLRLCRAAGHEQRQQETGAGLGPRHEPRHCVFPADRRGKELSGRAALLDPNAPEKTERGTSPLERPRANDLRLASLSGERVERGRRLAGDRAAVLGQRVRARGLVLLAEQRLELVAELVQGEEHLALRRVRELRVADAVHQRGELRGGFLEALDLLLAQVAAAQRVLQAVLDLGGEVRHALGVVVEVVLRRLRAARLGAAGGVRGVRLRLDAALGGVRIAGVGRAGTRGRGLCVRGGVAEAGDVHVSDIGASRRNLRVR